MAESIRAILDPPGLSVPLKRLLNAVVEVDFGFPAELALRQFYVWLALQRIVYWQRLIFESRSRPGEFDNVTPIFNTAFSSFELSQDLRVLMRELPPLIVPFGDIEAEFERILAMPDDLVREGIQMLIGFNGPTDLLCDFLLRQIAEHL